MSHELRYLGRLARRMISRGIAEPSLWNGNLIDIVSGSLESWSDRLTGGPLSVMDFEIFYTDQFKEVGLDPAKWHLGMKDYDRGYAEKVAASLRGETEPSQIGAIGLTLRRTRDITIREAVLRLETLHTGAGFSVYHVLQSALGHVVRAATPTWVQQMLYWWGDWNGPFEQHVRRTGGAPSAEEEAAGYEDFCPESQEDFSANVRRQLRLMPAELFEYRVSEFALRNARAVCENPADAAAIEDTLALRRVVSDMGQWTSQLQGPQSTDHMGLMDEEPELSAVICWDEYDVVAHMCDDHFECCYKNGISTDKVNLCGFLVSDDDEIDRALTSFSWTLRVLGLCDRIMQGLVSEEQATRGMDKRGLSRQVDPEMAAAAAAERKERDDWKSRRRSAAK